MITLTNQLACIRRQTAKMRERMQKKLRAGEQINRHAWENEIKNMEAICASLEKLVMLEEVSEEMKKVSA